MRRFEFDRNLRFSFILPYGYTSPQALLLSMPSTQMSYAVYSDSISMDERILACSRKEKANVKALTIMRELGYIAQDRKCCGKEKWENARYYYLTQAGFYLLTNTPNEQIEAERLNSIPRLHNRNKNELSYLPQDDQFMLTRQYLYDLAKDPVRKEAEGAAYDRLVLESVECGEVGILAAEPYLAEQIDTNPPHRADAFYRGWKLMNIEALFKANGYLTSLDRSPIQKAPNKADENMTSIYDFCTCVTHRWYNKYPNAFYYTTPSEKHADQLKNTWQNAPVFYPISAIDDALIEVVLNSPMNEKKTTRSYRHLCLGVAVGREKNYIIHHTRFGETPWAEFIESNTAGSIQQRLNKENERHPLLGAKRRISNAIIVCPSITQFAALFTAKQNEKADGNPAFRIGAPYENVCLVPVNPSGAMQIRGLMESSPENFEKAIQSFLLQYNGFTQQDKTNLQEYIFPLCYHGTPVLIAHAMNWKKLAIAKAYHDEGNSFYISCYPEQVKYIKAIMPHAAFL